ncbi:MAG: hypothetical protein D6730_09090, partial [Bacteroidetes bacterium]
MAQDAPNRLTRILLLLLSLLLIGVLLVLLFFRSGSGPLQAFDEVSRLVHAADLMAEIEELEQSVQFLEDTLSAQSQSLMNKDQVLMDKYLELEAMLRWINKLEQSSQVQADSIEMLRQRANELRQRLLEQRNTLEIEKLLEYDSLVVENEQLKQQLDSLRQLYAPEEAVSEAPQLLKVANIEVFNVQAGGQQNPVKAARRKQIHQLNVCVEFQSVNLRQGQRLYLVYENPDGTIRNSALNPPVKIRGKDFPYTNIAIVP